MSNLSSWWEQIKSGWDNDDVSFVNIFQSTVKPILWDLQIKGKTEIRSHKTSGCLIEVVTKADLTVIRIRSPHLPPDLSGKEKKGRGNEEWLL